MVSEERGLDSMTQSVRETMEVATRLPGVVSTGLIEDL